MIKKVKFSDVFSLLKASLQPGVSTYDVMDQLFDAYLCDHSTSLTPAQTSLWSRGERPVPAAYGLYYRTPEGFRYLESALQHQVLPYVTDKERLAEELEALVAADREMPRAMQEALLQELRGCGWLETSLAKLLVYSMVQRRA